MTHKYFEKSPFTKYDITFRMDIDVEMDIENSKPCTQEEVAFIIEKYSYYSSNYGSTQHVEINSRLDLSL